MCNTDVSLKLVKKKRKTPTKQLFLSATPQIFIKLPRICKHTKVRAQYETRIFDPYIVAEENVLFQRLELVDTLAFIFIIIELFHIIHKSEVLLR